MIMRPRRFTASDLSPEGFRMPGHISGAGDNRGIHAPRHDGRGFELVVGPDTDPFTAKLLTPDQAVRYRSISKNAAGIVFSLTRPNGLLGVGLGLPVRPERTQREHMESVERLVWDDMFWEYSPTADADSQVGVMDRNGLLARVTFGQNPETDEKRVAVVSEGGFGSANVLASEVINLVGVEQVVDFRVPITDVYADALEYARNLTLA